MADERPNVVVQYIEKTDAAPAPTCLEIITMLFVLGGLALMFGWFR